MVGFNITRGFFMKEFGMFDKKGRWGMGIDSATLGI